ncbi:hypothetical protein L596_020920 [Steinernema carpocapsae]|uniref:Uncharacterized protein n=1 Tax=Steinernema carpocapsae TaxID=34508 RepID=A0A4U5MV52_STECR|nr:hypothetical protein L596_020920 [Steinernema carpocapsae]
MSWLLFAPQVPSRLVRSVRLISAGRREEAQLFPNCGQVVLAQKPFFDNFRHLLAVIVEPLQWSVVHYSRLHRKLRRRRHPQEMLRKVDPPDLP